MPQVVSSSLAVVVNGVEYKQTASVTSNTAVNTQVSVPAAKTGALTTRTNDTSGTLTMDAGHGFTTAAVISLFWAGGSRRNVTVGTVSVNSVPISGGTGDNLPAAATAITAMVAVSEPFAVVGDNIDSLFASADSGVNGWVVFKTGANAVIAGFQLPVGTRSKVWASGLGITNPLAGQTVATVEFSHGSTSAQEMTAGVTV
jgi:hypothetical protein